MLLRSVSYDIMADTKAPIARAVRDANYDPIVMAFNIEALGKDDAPVIDVTRLFTTEVPEFSGRTRVARPQVRRVALVRRARRRRSRRTSKSKAIQTYNNPPDDGGGRGGGGPPRRRAAAARRRCAPGSATVVMHYSMVQLPETADDAAPVRRARRLLLDRQIDYGQDEHRAPQRRYITRWRLEKKDPDAALSEPVKPIVYYVDPATPTQVGAVREEGHRGLAAGVRGGRLQERDHREGSADADGGSGLERGRRALLGDPLAAVDDRERDRVRTSTIRAAARSSSPTSSSITTS